MHEASTAPPLGLLVADRAREKSTPTLRWPIPEGDDRNLHGLSTAALIAKAALAAQPGRSVVLGCGACTEIPIRLLNQRFARVDLVDIDASELDIVSEQCRRWRDAGDSYVFHSADLTGLVAQIEPRAHEIVAGAADPIRCLHSLGELMISTRPIPWTPLDGERYSLVVCATVLTQLQAGVREKVENVFLNRFPDECALLLDGVWQRCVWSFARNLENAFVEHLDNLIAPGGIVFLSATAHVSWLSTYDGQTLTTDGRWVAIRTSRLADYLRPWHKALATRRWDWFREEQEGQFWGRLYDVQAIVYQRSLESVQ